LIRPAGAFWPPLPPRRDSQRRGGACVAGGLRALRYGRRSLDDIPERPAPALTIGAPFGTLAHRGAGFFLALAARFWLNTVELVYSPSGVVFGAGATDLRVHAPMNAVMSVFSLVVALGIAWYGA